MMTIFRRLAIRSCPGNCIRLFPTKYIAASAIKYHLITLCLTTLLFLPTESAYAQNWYQVELIIFSQSDHFGEETYIPDVKLSYPEKLVQLQAVGTGNQFTRADKSAWSLNPDAYTLNRTGVYKVLYHEAWRQPGIALRSAPWLVISGGRSLGDHRELEGSIRLHLSNYLHLSTDLWLLTHGYSTTSGTGDQRDKYLSNYRTTDDLPRPPYLANASRAFEVANNPSTYASPATDISRIDTLKQSERLVLGKTHYLDHPKMGLLVKVVRATPPGSASAPQADPQNASANSFE